MLAVSFSPTVHATPPLACGRARPPGEVEPSTAQAFRLAALSAQFAGAGQVPGVGRRVGRRVERGRSLPFPPRKSRSPPGARGERPEGRDSPSCPTTCTQSPDPRVWTWERELSNRIRQVPRFFPKAHGCPLSGASRMGSGRARSVPGGAVSDPDSHSRGRGARRAQPLRTVLSRLQLSPRLPPGARSPGSRPGSGDPKAGLERSQFWVRGGVCLRQRPREKQSVQ